MATKESELEGVNESLHVDLHRAEHRHRFAQSADTEDSELAKKKKQEIEERIKRVRKRERGVRRWRNIATAIGSYARVLDPFRRVANN